MAEDLTDTASTTETPLAWARMRGTITQVYVLALALLTLILLVVYAEPARLLSDGVLFLLFLIISIVCSGLDFSPAPGIAADLQALFGGAAVLTLGFNGVWVPLLSEVYWVLRRRQRLESFNSWLVFLFNATLNSLPWWLGLFVYHDLLGGELPLVDPEGSLGPILAFVLVVWGTLLVGMLIPMFFSAQEVGNTMQWFRGALPGLFLSFWVPMLFSPAIAVILNNLGVGFFLFISVGLLGISLMAQRLARSLDSERRRVEELTALNAFSEDIIHRPPGVEATGELLAKHAPRFIPDADFQLCLLDAERPEKRRIVADWRDGAAQPGGEAPATAAWTWLRDQRQPLHAADVAQASLPFAWNDEHDGVCPGSLLLVPLLASDPTNPKVERCIGGIQMSHAQPNTFTPEVLPSVTALANQLAAALENARLHREALARERLERELALARGIQTSFLPADVPHVAGWVFVASLEPARYVSGDFYDFIPLPGGCWGVLIADVADKGMPAALYMALARTLIRAHAADHAADPAACLLAANDQILADTQSDLFVTIFYAILDPATGAMTFANAGHNPPYLFRHDGRPAEPLRNTGMALGVMPGITLDNGQANFAPGDYLVLYTDGVTEAHNPELDEFGSDRLLAQAASSDGVSAATIHHRIRAAVAEFVGDAPQFDDLTLMIVSRGN